MSLGDVKAREQLVLCCVPLVRMLSSTPICHKFSNREDSFQDGMLGVLEAVDKYDYTKNAMFTTYAYKYIYKRILNGVVSRTPLKMCDKDFFNTLLINSTIESFKKTHQIPPTYEQLAQLTSISQKDIKLLLNRNIQNVAVSLDDGCFVSLPASDSDVYATVEKILKQGFREKTLKEAINVLTAEEKDIICERFLYKNGKTTLKELAARQHISINAVEKREKSALKKMSAYFAKHHISFDDMV